MSVVIPSLRAAIAVPPWVKNELWRRARAVPSLDLRFADNKSLVDAVTGASLITFNRASSGTYTDSAGVIQTASNNVPRFDHNPITGESLGLLVEEQRTNLLLRSEEFNDASWTKQVATITANTTTAPNSSVSASKLIGNSSIESHYAQQNFSGATNGISYTSSFYAKASEITRIEILHHVGATLYAQGYDLSSGTLLTRVTGVTAATGGFIQAVGDGWYRCGITQTSDGTTGAVRIILRSANTVNFDATSQGVLLWGAQLEASSAPGSYIPTTTAAVTRNADVASITGSAFSGWYRQDEGTVLSAFSIPTSTTTGGARVYNISNSGGTAQAWLRLQGGTNRVYEVTDSSIQQAVLSAGAFSAGVLYRGAVALKTNDFGFSENSSTPTVDNSGTLSTVDRMGIGMDPSGAAVLNGHIRRLTYWPQRLADSTLQQITQ
jgi:hypothetical protein